MSQLRTGDNAARRAFVREITNSSGVYERPIINFALVGISTYRVYYEKTTVVANESLDNLKFISSLRIEIDEDSLPLYESRSSRNEIYSFRKELRKISRFLTKSKIESRGFSSR